MRTTRKHFLAIAATGALFVLCLAPAAAQAQTATVQSLQRLFVSIVGRPVDAVALSFYLGQSNTGAANAIANSPEANIGALSSAQIVDKFYINMFGHVASPAASSFWSAQLGSGLTPGALAIAIDTTTTSGIDQVTFNNKVAAATVLYNALDTAPEILAYSNNAAYAIGRTYLASVTDTSASLTAATDPANIQSVINQILLTNAVTLQSVKSRKTHGSLPGSFDVDINTTGPISVEPRVGRNGHLIVFRFSGAINNAGTVQVTPVGIAATPVTNGNTVEVMLTGIPDNQRVTISLTGVNGIVPATLTMGFLVGDVNSSGIVSAADISAVKARAGQQVNTANVRADVDANGKFDQADVSAVKARSGRVLP